MAHAHAEVVPATVSDDADVGAWRGNDVTVRLVRAIVAGIAREPSLNVWYDSQSQGRRLHRKIDLGIAVDTEDGLFVPVLRDVANRAPADLRQGLDRMKADIVARTIPPEEMRGATITLSNFGSLAGRYAAPVVVPPQVAILSTGRAAARPVAVGSEIVVRRVMPLSLTFDHRVVTGGEAARFLAAVIADLELPE
jgi:pyruvate dehydrogenase E2 component (dihydrolipoamide acetyltransferase)